MGLRSLGKSQVRLDIDKIHDRAVYFVVDRDVGARYMVPLMEVWRRLPQAKDSRLRNPTQAEVREVIEELHRKGALDPFHMPTRFREFL
jgi:hypothetical protein